MSVNVKEASEAQKSGSASKKSPVTIIKSWGMEIEKLLPANAECTRDQLMSAVLNCVYEEPGLTAGTNIRLLHSAVCELAQNGLLPNTKSGAAVLTIDKKGKFSFEIMYIGLRDVAYRRYGILTQTRAVCENDDFVIEYGDNAVFRHKPALPPKNGAVIFYYATTVVDKERYLEWISPEEAEAHRIKYAPYSKAWNSAPEAMAKKTVLKRLLKSIPKSEKLASLLNAEDLDVAGADMPVENEAGKDTEKPSKIPADPNQVVTKPAVKNVSKTVDGSNESKRTASKAAETTKQTAPKEPKQTAPKEPKQTAPKEPKQTAPKEPKQTAPKQEVIKTPVKAAAVTNQPQEDMEPDFGSFDFIGGFADEEVVQF